MGIGRVRFRITAARMSCESEALRPGTALELQPTTPKTSSFFFYSFLVLRRGPSAKVGAAHQVLCHVH